LSGENSFDDPEKCLSNVGVCSVEGHCVNVEQSLCCIILDHPLQDYGWHIGFIV